MFHQTDMEEIIENLKYKTEISELIAEGINIPNELVTPNDFEAYRWIFDHENKSNHIPIYKQHPQRFIKDTEKKELTTSGYALSCFNSEYNAENTFNKFSKSFPNFWKLVGNSISKGIIREPDGRLTHPSNTGHFDLYEFVECNLNHTFVLIKKLI